MENSELLTWIQQNPKLAQMKQSTRYPELSVAKYKRAVFYDNLWNEALEECRGAVWDTESGKLIALPFRKIYNYGIDPNSPKFENDEPCEAYRKVNGYMLAATCYNEQTLLSTTGSLDSDFVGYGEELIAGLTNPDLFHRFIRAYSGYTHLFEAVHPEDPHIVPETAGLYYLGSRATRLGSEIINVCADHADVTAKLALSGVFVVEPWKTTVGEVMEAAKTVAHEGFVFYTANGASKVKTPYYLVSNLMSRTKNLDRLLQGKAKNYTDEEYHGLIDAIAENRETFSVLSEQDRLSWIREHFGKIYI